MRSNIYLISSERLRLRTFPDIAAVQRAERPTASRRCPKCLETKVDIFKAS